MVRVIRIRVVVVQEVRLEVEVEGGMEQQVRLEVMGLQEMGVPVEDQIITVGQEALAPGELPEAHMDLLTFLLCTLVPGAAVEEVEQEEGVEATQLEVVVVMVTPEEMAVESFT
jgi:hypothetical protein